MSRPPRPLDLEAPHRRDAHWDARGRVDDLLGRLREKRLPLNEVKGALARLVLAASAGRDEQSLLDHLEGAWAPRRVGRVYAERLLRREGRPVTLGRARR